MLEPYYDYFHDFPLVVCSVFIYFEGYSVKIVTIVLVHCHQHSVLDAVKGWAVAFDFALAAGADS